ncbi:hypothetical protein P3T36_000557 [Kitasatospora sp. MAP12-15]|uniref:SAF domain-containing protein n=1 Tax=unclassified Kitasatospora TaxID=2633591 RepID=UPI00247478A2|nr:SAF domain-containing protein [Kitasatospora sp. MAP12-44]MDH6114156.1 hypothetical protein [Kitasatospora sp. MAP12-44]
MENRTFPSPTLGTPAFQEQSAVVAGPGRGGDGRPAPVAPSRSLRARRRRPAVIAMAAALIAAGGLGGAVLYNSTGQRIAVLALARDVPYGQPLTADDLVVARIASDPALSPVAAGDLNLAVGERATTDLHRGALLLVADVTRALAVAPTDQVVGLSARQGQLPADGLEPGQRVIIVLTDPSVAAGSAGGGAAHPAGPPTMGAVVAHVGKAGGDGTQVVDVAVPPSDGPVLAFWVASGKFQVILAPRDAAASPSPSSSPPSSPSTGANSGGGTA